MMCFVYLSVTVCPENDSIIYSEDIYYIYIYIYTAVNLQKCLGLDIYQYINISSALWEWFHRKFTSSQSNVDKHVISSIY